MKIASFFSGCGGLDLGFKQAGFELVFANDNWEGCKETFELNHNIPLVFKSIVDVKPEEVPDVDGFVGGPPCQSWSLAGAMRGINDQRGQVFYEYVRLLKAKRPKFFLAENVPGIISSAHIKEFLKLLNEFKKAGYNVEYVVLNAKDYGVPQERTRVFVVGFRDDLNIRFRFQEPKQKAISLREAIGDMPESMPAKDKNRSNDELKSHQNHEHMNGSFSTIYMSRNRRKEWDQPSFTIQAGGRHAPLHPSSPKMIKVEENKWRFDDNLDLKVRRLSVRECARIQTFPDNFVFKYSQVADGYKMIGNAVPVALAKTLATSIIKHLALIKTTKKREDINISVKQHHDDLKHPRLGNILEQSGVDDNKIISTYRNDFDALLKKITDKIKEDYPQAKYINDLPENYKLSNVHSPILKFLEANLTKNVNTPERTSTLFSFLTANMDFIVIKNENNNVVIKEFTNISRPTSVDIWHLNSNKLYLNFNNKWSISLRIHPDTPIFKDNGDYNKIDKLAATLTNEDKVIKKTIIPKANYSLNNFSK